MWRADVANYQVAGQDSKLGYILGSMAGKRVREVYVQAAEVQLLCSIFSLHVSGKYMQVCEQLEFDSIAHHHLLIVLHNYRSCKFALGQSLEFNKADHCFQYLLPILLYFFAIFIRIILYLIYDECFVFNMALLWHFKLVV